MPATSFAFAHRDTTTSDSIIVADLAAGTQQAIVSAGDTITGLAISPDRRSIAYVTSSAAFVVGVDGGNPHQVSEPISPPTGYYPNLDAPEWSPDGSTIYLGFGLYDAQDDGGTTLATVPASGGTIEMLPGAEGSNCRIVTDSKFSPGGAYLVTVHELCIDNNNNGLWKHAPDGTGEVLLPATTQLELTKPVVFANDVILALSQVDATNGLIVVQNGAITGMQDAPAGTSMDDITASPDGNTLVVHSHDTTSFASDLYVTTDLKTFTAITSDGKNWFPSF